MDRIRTELRHRLNYEFNSIFNAGLLPLGREGYRTFIREQEPSELRQGMKFTWWRMFAP